MVRLPLPPHPPAPGRAGPAWWVQGQSTVGAATLTTETREGPASDRGSSVEDFALRGAWNRLAVGSWLQRCWPWWPGLW